MDSLNFTFKTLQQYFKQHIAGHGRVPTSAQPNLHSALNGFVQERGLTEDTVIGSTLRASYRRSLDAHTEQLRKQGRSSAYISNRRSLLAHWRHTLIDADRKSAARENRQSPLQAALAELFGKTGATYKGTARASGIPLATLKRWATGAAPNAQSARWLPRLESLFALPPGTLSDLVAAHPDRSERSLAQAPRIAYRERLARHSKDVYALKEPCPRLRDEWATFLRYKTAPGQAANRRLRRSKSGRWSLTSNAVKPRTPALWYAYVGDEYAATADIAWGLVSQFLGWLHLPLSRGGRGEAAESAETLANFARADVIQDYVSWRIARSDGHIHAGITKFLQFVAGVTHPETGYLTQSYDTVAGVTMSLTRDSWAQKCRDAFELARALIPDLEQSESAGPSRDSFEPIAATLNLANPLEAVADMVARLDADRPSTGGVREAVWARDRLLIKLLASNPLRDKNLRLLTFDELGTGKLRKADGAWRICIPRAEFKNAKGAARDRDYDMVVRPEVWPDIERYLRDYRPMLAKPGNPYVFVSSRTDSGPMPSLRRHFAALTRQYLAQCPGVGPHAMRHIVATSILKANPNAWTTAAIVLHDREETVRQHYAHLRCDDAQRWLDSAMTAPFQRM